MPAPTLLSMAIRACTRNINGITDVADMPYNIIHPVLKKIQNPGQLHEIETHCPQIADASADLWRAFIARDIPNWPAKILEPKNPRSWWKVYRKLVADEKRAKEAQEEELRAAMSGLSAKREENKATYVGRVVSVKSRERAFVDGVRNPNVNGWGGERAPVLKNAKRAKDVMSALRAQSRQAARDRNFDVGRGPAFSTAGQLSKPVAKPVVREVQRVLPVPAEPLVPRGRDLGFAAQKGPSVVQTALAKAEAEVARLKALAVNSRPDTPPARLARPEIAGRTMDSTAEREARLKALTQPKPKTARIASPPKEVPRVSAAAASPSSRKRPASSLEGEASVPIVSSRITANDAAVGTPTSMPETFRRRPTATYSPLMPAKRRKV
ncbi:hypothetical protein LTR91_011819 [Friedmanniomyces endolithicus]|uniref:Elongin-A n=2 Tax=Dothideomycetidae TaxID=451867 RepID=A0AAN6KGX3_9PEZI|nr:hypothetical protein LTR94_010625 [Friedmanniomyces endolithicus]KAK5139314.1 hypothetical protein LTR32_007489 [Rachicladosporium monterosium]KAK0787659.1 hypothetical protein LTR38_011601 [Friedmanniomyces endolithicus]KAK0789005.1 hypothetical protein LTR59_009816 [Friedmanniomyces endolithicus]KAK0829105.1 hypothetical protein LTR03_016384 [Friedmanniomyces endolithicus]